jgi:hypothetical protein
MRVHCNFRRASRFSLPVVAQAAIMKVSAAWSWKGIVKDSAFGEM